MTIVSTAILPGHSFRARSHAINVANGRMRIVLASAISSEKTVICAISDMTRIIQRLCGRLRRGRLSFRKALRREHLEQRPVPVEKVEMLQIDRRNPADILKDPIRDRPSILVDAKKHQIELSTAGITLPIAKNPPGSRDLDIKLFL